MRYGLIIRIWFPLIFVRLQLVARIGYYWFGQLFIKSDGSFVKVNCHIGALEWRSKAVAPLISQPFSAFETGCRCVWKGKPSVQTKQLLEDNWRRGKRIIVLLIIKVCRQLACKMYERHESNCVWTKIDEHWLTNWRTLMTLLRILGNGEYYFPQKRSLPALKWNWKGFWYKIKYLPN